MVLNLDYHQISKLVEVGGKRRNAGEHRGILKSMRRYRCTRNTLKKQGRRALVPVHRKSYSTN
jgi:hypothetical protein